MYSKVYVEITNICNMSCSFCHGHKRERRKMSKSEFEHVLSALTGQTGYIYYHLMGEPLTHPFLPEFIKTAGERGYKSILTTNGTLLSRRCGELLESGLHKVNISVHSFESGTADEHARYIREVADFAKRAAEKGIITVLRLWNKGSDGGKNGETIRLLKESISGEWAENTRGIRVRERLFIDWGERFEWPDSEAEIKGSRFFCYGLKDQFGILADGTVVPCCLDSEGVIALGNIFEQDIEEILRSERASAMRDGFCRGIATEELCKRCGYAQRFV